MQDKQHERTLSQRQAQLEAETQVETARQEKLRRYLTEEMRRQEAEGQRRLGDPRRNT